MKERVKFYKQQYELAKKNGYKKIYSQFILDMGYGSKPTFSFGEGISNLFDPTLRKQGILVPKFATDLRFMNALGKAIQGHKGYADIIKKTAKNYYGGAIDIQKHLAPLGELHLRTPTGKKYNYCGPGTKLEERLASSDPKYRDPINNLDAICQQHDIAYSEAGDNLAKKHAADKIMEDSISAIPFNQRPWFATPTMYAIKTKRKLGLGVPKNGKSRRVITGEKN